MTTPRTSNGRIITDADIEALAELNEQIAARAEQDGVTTSDVIREALRRYLGAS